MNQVNIVIVEDEIIIAKNIARKLKNLNYNVCKIFASGQPLIDYITIQKPDIILMDIAIRGEMDGIETASKIKDIADIPVIFLTAYATPEVVERASETSCYGYIVKPFKDEELYATLKIALKKHQENSIVKKSLQDTIKEYSSQIENLYINNQTNLPNRLFLRDSFDYLVASINGEQLVAVLNISIDRFKKISDFLSKEQQDSLITEVAKRLQNYVENCGSQGITIYMKEDHFIIMIALDRKIQADNYAKEISNLLGQAIYLENQEIFLSTSIGIAFYPSDSFNIEELLQQSEKARDYARSQGANRHQSFSFAFNVKISRSSEGLHLEAELHHALEREQLELYYQPKIDLKTNSIVGAEALVRWNHPTMGRFEPYKFIPLAEESGLIRPIGEWILNRACQQNKAWQNAGLNDLTISVNISGIQFKQSDLFHQVTQVLFNSSLEPQYLELELTEDILVENIKINIQKLNILKKAGVKITLDNFGTGYSSLGYLQQFPFDILKIDSCFTHNIDSNKINATITKNVIDMAHDLGLTVVAQGIETEAELNNLKKCNCDEIQGFLFYPPLNAKEFKNLLLSNKSIYSHK
ncbi:MAG: EAL domain-containing protein [Xenococcaceae cyanobacterium MO_188.B19]|nr:EAL domain-containing protein [Xenococcaceae cyanobacterium MO_188.B19]